MRPKEKPQPSPDLNIDEDNNDKSGKISGSDMSDNEMNDRQLMSGSGSDTEDEIERILTKKKAKLKENEKLPTETDIYNVTTEEDIRAAGSTSSEECVPSLPDFYRGKTFYIADNISCVDEIKLRRYITVYQGTIIDSASSADFIISNDCFSTASSFKGEIVKPLWIFECSALKCFLSTKRYLI